MKIQNRVEFQVVADLVLVFIINPLTKKHFGNDYAGKLQSETFPDNCLFPEQVSGSVPDICYGPRYIPRTVPDMFRAARNRDKTISDNCSVPELLPGTVFDI